MWRKRLDERRICMVDWGCKKVLNKGWKIFRTRLLRRLRLQLSTSLGKLFKGLSIELLKKRPVKTHKLTTLYKPLEKYARIEEELKDFLSLISPYYFITRYPDIAMGLPGEIITENFAKDCLTKTRRVFLIAFRSLYRKRSETLPKKLAN